MIKEDNNEGQRNFKTLPVKKKKHRHLQSDRYRNIIFVLFILLIIHTTLISKKRPKWISATLYGTKVKELDSGNQLIRLKGQK